MPPTNNYEVIRLNDLIIRQQDLVTNPTPRVPICLVLDTSGSMYGTPIGELNIGVKTFFDAILSDEVAQWSAEISIVTFGDTAKQILDFAAIQKQTVQTLNASGSTPMGAAVNLALDLLETRKKEYSDAGVDYYQPWMVLMTDGQPTDDIESSVHRTCETIEKRKLTIFPIGIGQDADMFVLARFSPKRQPLRVKGLNFKGFFEWLSQSVVKVSQSTPGEKVNLDIEGIKDWADL